MFCMSSHAAAARELYSEQSEVVDCVIENKPTPMLSNKMKALLNIAGKVQVSGKSVTQADIDDAKNHGANDRDIHDTVLISATFSMFNRYVDGLGTLTPTDSKDYVRMGQRMATLGYVPPAKPN
jgi:uncharacterized peroxidase-related enzyme